MARRAKGSGSIEQRGGVFYLRVQDNGKRRMVRIFRADGQPATTREEAQRAVQERLGDILGAKSEVALAALRQDARNRSVRQRVPLADVWREYEPSCKASPDTKCVYAGYWRRFCEAFPGRMLEDVSPVQAESYLESISVGKSNRHYNANLTLLSQLYRWTIRHGWTEKNPFADIKARKADTHSHSNFSEEEVTRIFEWFNTMPHRLRDCDEIRTLMTLSCWTGLRMIDAIHVRKSDVDFDRDIITVTPQKTMRTSGITVRVPLHSALRAELEQADARTPGEEYFLPNLVRRYANTSTRGSIGKAVERIICDALGVEGQVEVEGRERRANAYGLHSFRHTFVSFCASAGVPIEVVKAMVGHTTDVTRVYTHISEKAMRGAIDALETKSADLRERVSAMVRCASQRQLEACLAILEN